MTEIIIHSASLLDTWLHQNGVKEVDDYAEGCLLDNLLVSCRRGVAAIYEKYVNGWSSEYRVLFAPYKNEKQVQKIQNDWYARFPVGDN